MKQVAGRLRLDLAQFRELEAFAEFGSDLDKASQAQLDRGRVVEVLKQKQYTPYPVEDQVISIWSVTNGYMDDVPLGKVNDFEQALIEHVKSRHGGIGQKIIESGKLDDATAEQLRSAVEEFKAGWVDREGAVETTASTEGVPEANSPVVDAAAVGSGGGAPTNTTTPSDATQSTGRRPPASSRPSRPIDG